jgi:type II secretory pathway pseudopilin PulG
MKSNTQGGFTLLEVMFVFVILAIAIPIFYSMIKSSVDVSNERLAASQFKTVTQAAGKYVKSNWNDLYNSIATNGPKYLTTSDLVTQGFLPPNWNASLSNVWGQSTRVALWAGSGAGSGAINMAVMTYGGRGGSGSDHFSSVSVPGAAQFIGSHGGFVKNLTTAQGLTGSWSLALGGGGIPPSPAGPQYPTPGHLVALYSYNQGTLSSDYLYRHKVAGNPDLNRMHTDIDMNGSSIDNADTVHDEFTDTHQTSTAKSFKIGNDCYDCTLDAQSVGPEHELIGLHPTWGQGNSVYIGGDDNTDAVVAGSPNHKVPLITHGVLIGESGVTTGAGQLLSLTPQNMGVVKQGSFVVAPSCPGDTPAGDEQGAIAAAATNFTGQPNGNGDAIGGVRVRADGSTQNGTEGWTLHLEVLARHGGPGGTPAWIPPNGQHARIMFVTKCVPI